MESVNEAISLPVGQYAKFFLVINVLTLLLAILSYKRLYLADYFFTLNCVVSVGLAFHPNQKNHDAHSMDVVIYHFVLYLTYSNAWLWDMFVAVTSIAINLFVGITVLYDRPLDVSTVATYTGLLLVCFLTTVILNMLVILIARVNAQRRLAHESHISLLDGMHEGLLILSQATDRAPQQFMFCNKPAQKLIKRYLGPIDACHNDKNGRDVQAEIMTKQSFNQAKFVRAGDRDSPGMGQSRPRSLQQIILAQCDEPSQRHCIYRLD